MKMKNPSKVAILSAIAVFTACKTPPPPPPPTVQISCKIPKITPLPETTPSQEKGGLEIAMVPALYKAVRSDRTTITPVEPTYAEQLGLGLTGGMAGRVFVEKTTTPELKSQPNRLQFTVRVNNKLSRVFRGQGAVVQFNVAGKLIPFGNTDYKDFINGIVPPRNEAQLTIHGPPLDMIPDQGTMGIYLYDVITATDAAGNVTEKQNYDWFFSYVMETLREPAAAPKVRGPMSQTDYQQYLMKQQQELLQQRMQGLQTVVQPTQP